MPIVIVLPLSITVGDTFLLDRRMNKHLSDKLGAGNLPCRTQMYGVMRTLQRRRTRLSKPHAATSR